MKIIKHAKDLWYDACWFCREVVMRFMYNHHEGFWCLWILVAVLFVAGVIFGFIDLNAWLAKEVK